jgi:hypothetical protein
VQQEVDVLDMVVSLVVPMDFLFGFPRVDPLENAETPAVPSNDAIRITIKARQGPRLEAMHLPSWGCRSGSI